MKKFWEKVEKSKCGCWFWKGSIDKFGYGIFHVNRRTRKKAHRLSWEIHYGVIPGGLCVCHTCDRPNCVNPLHLWLGTNLENRRDCERKGRHAKGSGNGRARLRESDVVDIRRRHKRYCKVNGTAAIASDYGMNEKVIHEAIVGKTWKHVRDFLQGKL